jgi:hypothetical protein
VKRRKVLVVRLAITVTALLLVITAGAQEPKPRPTFDNFPVKKIWKGIPAAPKLSKDQRFFRTMIRRGAKAQVEFAASGVTSKPATRGRLKTGHGEWPKTSVVLPCRGGFGQGRI